MDFDTTILFSKDREIYSERGIKIDNKNNKFIIGNFKGTINVDTFTLSTLPTITNNTYVNAQGAFLAKYDSSEKLLWVKKLAEADTFFYVKLYLDLDDNLLISYVFNSKLYIDNDSIVTQLGRNNINLFKYDNDGTLLFSKKFSGNAAITGGITFNENNEIFAGINFGEDTVLNYSFIFGLDTLNATRGDYLITKFDTLFNPQWTKKYGSSSVDGIGNIVYSEDHLYVLSGAYGSANNIDVGGLIFSFPFNYLSKYYIAKLDTSGNAIWVKKFGNSDFNTGVATLHSNSLSINKGHIFFTGHAFSNNQNVFLFEGGPTLTGNGNSNDYFIACYDTAGDFKWNTISNTFGSDALSQLAVDSNSNVYGVGSMNYTSRFPTDTLSTHGYDDALVVSYDSIGTFRWAINGGGAGTDVGNGIALDSHGKPYIVGGTTSSGGCYMGNDTLYPPSNQSTLFFASIDSIAIQTPLSNANFSMVNSELKVFPNPASTLLNVEDTANSFKEGEIELYNVVGQLIYTLPLKLPSTGNMQLKIDVSQLPNGIYYLQLKNKQSSITKKINIQH